MSTLSDNHSLSDREIECRKSITASKPRRLIVTLSTKCNARCIMCEVRHVHWDIPRKTLGEITGLFPSLESIAWQGGEVFFLDFFAEVFDEALKYPDLKQTVVSNGLLLNDTWIEKLVAANMELALSIDGVTRDVYEKIRSGSKYDLLFKNVRQLNAARKKAGSRLNLRMHTVVMRSNYHQIEEFVDLAGANGFDALHMMPIWGGQEIDENIFLPGSEAILDQVRERIGRAGERARALGIEFLNSLPLERAAAAVAGEPQIKEGSMPEPARSGSVPEELLCYLPWQQLNIDPGGDVRPGCLCSRSIGSVMERSLLELWNGELMQEYRRRVTAKGKGWCSAQCLQGAMPLELRRV